VDFWCKALAAKNRSGYIVHPPLSMLRVAEVHTSGREVPDVLERMARSKSAVCPLKG
jgi:hypothetical protein